MRPSHGGAWGGNFPPIEAITVWAILRGVRKIQTGGGQGGVEEPIASTTNTTTTSPTTIATTGTAAAVVVVAAAPRGIASRKHCLGLPSKKILSKNGKMPAYHICLYTQAHLHCSASLYVKWRRLWGRSAMLALCRAATASQKRGGYSALSAKSEILPYTRPSTRRTREATGLCATAAAAARDK